MTVQQMITSLQNLASCYQQTQNLIEILTRNLSTSDDTNFQNILYECTTLNQMLVISKNLTQEAIRGINESLPKLLASLLGDLQLYQHLVDNAISATADIYYYSSNVGQLVIVGAIIGMEINSSYHLQNASQYEGPLLVLSQNADKLSQECLMWAQSLQE